MKVKPSTTYTISVGNDNVTAFRVCALKNGANNESSTNAYQWESGNMVCTITTASDENYLIVQISKAILEAHTGQIMVEEGSTAHAYEPYTNTIYGGYVDLVTGEVWKTWENVDLGSLNWTYQAESTRFFSNGISSATKKPKGNGVASSALCEIYKTVALTQLADKTFAVATSGNYFIKDTDYTDKDELITAITGKYLAYELATPTLITTLSPTQINAIKGNNTVWSDGNGDCEVTFLKKG